MISFVGGECDTKTIIEVPEVANPETVTPSVVTKEVPITTFVHSTTTVVEKPTIINQTNVGVSEERLQSQLNLLRSQFLFSNTQVPNIYDDDKDKDYVTMELFSKQVDKLQDNFSDSDSVSFTTSEELATILSDETGTAGKLVFSQSPTFTGLATLVNASTTNFTVTGNSYLGSVSAGTLSLSAPLSLTGSAANINLGSNWLSGDGDDEGIFVDASGNVGIGTTTPNTLLSVAGRLIANSLDVNSRIGYQFEGITILTASSTRFSTYVGLGAGASSTLAGYDTAIGYQSLYFNTTGVGNTANGYQSLYSNTTGSENTAIGAYSLLTNTTAISNTAIGQNALRFNNADGNTAIGRLALYSNTTGFYNTASGFYAQGFNTTGSENTAVGVTSLYLNTSGSYNTAIGRNALRQNISATSSTAVGYEAARSTANYSNQGGVYLGFRSGYSAGNGSDFNTFIGYQSGYGVTTGSNNIWLGSATSSTAIANLTTGSQNILIGNNISLPSATANGQLNIGNILFGTGITGISTTLSAGNLGIGTTTPSAKFAITGTAGINDIFVIASSTNSRLLTMTSAGNVGIGTSTPSAQLTVNSTVRFVGITGGSLETDSLGNVTVSSDERLKNIEGLYEAGLEEILGINPIVYRWNDNSGFDKTTLYAGFSAQNVESMLPDAVGEDNRGFKTLSIRPILAALVNAVKEMWARLTGVEASVAEHDAEINELREYNQLLEERLKVIEAELNIESETEIEDSETTPDVAEEEDEEVTEEEGMVAAEVESEVLEESEIVEETEEPTPPEDPEVGIEESVLTDPAVIE